jgi:hypothetical protein
MVFTVTRGFFGYIYRLCVMHHAILEDNFSIHSIAMYSRKTDVEKFQRQ